MALKDFLQTDETIKYRSPNWVEFQGADYDLLVTDKRLIWYRQDGLIFKKDNFISEWLDNVKSVSFKEEGILNKRGTVILSASSGEKRFSGRLSVMRALLNEVQSLIAKPQTGERIVREIVREPVYIRERTTRAVRYKTRTPRRKSFRRGARKKSRRH